MEDKTMKKRYTMREVFAALHKEFYNEADARNIFEWYCRTYKVTIADAAPASVAHEVFGV